MDFCVSTCFVPRLESKAWISNQLYYLCELIELISFISKNFSNPNLSISLWTGMIRVQLSVLRSLSPSLDDVRKVGVIVGEGNRLSMVASLGGIMRSARTYDTCYSCYVERVADGLQGVHIYCPRS